MIGDDGLDSSRKRKSVQYNSDPPPLRHKPTPVRQRVTGEMLPPDRPTPRAPPGSRPDISRNLPQIRIQSTLPLAGTSNRQPAHQGTPDRFRFQPQEDDRSFENKQRRVAHDTALMSGALLADGHYRDISHYVAGTNTLTHQACASAEPSKTYFTKPHRLREVLESPQVRDLSSAQTQPFRNEAIRQVVPRQTQRASVVPWSEPGHDLQHGQITGYSDRFHGDTNTLVARQSYIPVNTPSPSKRNPPMLYTTNNTVCSPSFHSGSSNTISRFRGNVLAQPVAQNSAHILLGQDYEPQSARRISTQTPRNQDYSINGLSFIDRPHSTFDQEPSYGRHHATPHGYRPTGIIQGALRDQNGYFTRPEHAQEPTVVASSGGSRRPRPLSSTQPSLHALPSPQTRGASARNESLHVVKGAKAAGTHSGLSSLQGGHSAAFRGMHPSNGRRPVRR